jgi:ribosome biogenesis GTPase
MVHHSRVETPDSPAAAWRAARVLAAFGRQALVRNAGGVVATARPANRQSPVVCGDLVDCSVDAQHRELLITHTHARSTTLWRSNARGVPEPVAANATQMLIIVAPLPEPDWYVVDRYLAAAEIMAVPALLVANKSDLVAGSGIRAELQQFAALGYATLECSAIEVQGLDALLLALQAQCSLLVGQSGVGKSSLLTRLVPGSVAATGALMRGVEGRHTTTVTRWHDFAAGGALLDSPGVRDFAPALELLDAHSLGFREIASLGAACRFADCKHLLEPACAVRAALDAGQLTPRRYESYRRLRRLHNDRLTTLQRAGNQGR